jgi:hypothetical protein
MRPNGRRVYMLAEYTVEHKKDGWYFGRSTRYGEEDEMKGPYRSVSSVTLVIARQLKREIARRDAPRLSEA